jgi:hypothetical protein
MKVQVEIDRVTLVGFDCHDSEEIGLAINQELSYLIRKNGLSQKVFSSQVAHLDSILFKISVGVNQGNVGKEIARIVYGTLRK